MGKKISAAGFFCQYYYYYFFCTYTKQAMENFVLLNAINAIFLGNARKTGKDNIFEKKITLNQEDQHKNFV